MELTWLGWEGLQLQLWELLYWMESKSILLSLFSVYILYNQYYLYTHIY